MGRGPSELPTELTRPIRFRVGHDGDGLNTGKMAPTCPSQGKWRLSSSPHFEATHLNLLPGTSLTPLSYCPSSRAQGECLQVRESLCGLFKRRFGFPAAFRPTWMVRISTVFHSQMLWGSPRPRTSTLWAGVPCSSWGNLHDRDIPSCSQPPHGGLRLACFASPLFLPVLT